MVGGTAKVDARNSATRASTDEVVQHVGLTALTQAWSDCATFDGRLNYRFPLHHWRSSKGAACSLILDLS